MSTDQIQIRDATPGQLDTLAGIIGTAFSPLAVSRYLVPDADARRDILTRHLYQLVEHAYHHGRVHTDPDTVCVAVWFPAADPDDAVPAIADYATIRTQICGPHAGRMAAFETAIHAHHPDRPPHWHLALLAVLPGLQGRGLGSALLRHHHTRLDSRGKPAFLEASDPRSRDLYLRHGYLDAGEPYPIGPEDAPLMYPLWREAGALERRTASSQP